MEKKMVFILNPRSGKGTIRHKLLEIVDLFVKHGWQVDIHPTQCAGDACTVAAQRSGDVDLVVACGGDGTLDEVVRGMLKSGADKPLGYIPAGSTNDFAASLELPKDIEEAAKVLMEGTTSRVDIGRFNDEAFAYIAAFGLFTDVAYKTDQTLKNILGYVAYLLEGAKRLFDIKSYHMLVNADGRLVERDYIYGMVTNSRSVGGFRNLTGKHVRMDDGLFEVTLIHRPKNLLELNEIVQSLLAGEDDTDLIDTFRASRVEIDSAGEVPWTLDGEYGGDHMNVRIVVEKQALAFCMPDRTKPEDEEKQNGPEHLPV